MIVYKKIRSQIIKCKKELSTGLPPKQNCRDCMSANIVPKFPVIVSMRTTNSSYNHVICIWNNAIIDYEHRSTYPLTINNLDFLCGSSQHLFR